MPGQSLFVGGPADTDRFLSMQDARRALSGLLATNSADPMDIRTGVLYSGNSTLLTGTAGLSVNVAAFHFSASKGSANGAYLGNNPATLPVTVPAAPALGSKRVDVVWVQQQDKGAAVAPDAATTAVFGVTAGTATTGTPSKNAIPAGAEEVGTITWDSTSTVATATNAAQCTLATTCKWTCARGGAIPVRSLTERNALTGYKGLRALRLDRGGAIDTHDGTAWDFTDWTNLPIDPGGWDTPGGQVRWQASRRGRNVYYRGALLNSTFSGTATLVLALPAGIPPPVGATVPLSLASNTANNRAVWVQQDGTVQVYAEGASNAWFIIGGSYTVD